jgi:small subunit ribosomal protein S17
MMNEEKKETKKISLRNRKEGFVVSLSGDKSVIVKVDRLMRHPKFHRVIKKTKKYMVHDENNLCKLGDKIEIIESRPMSKSKRWRLVRIVEASK